MGQFESLPHGCGNLLNIAGRKLADSTQRPLKALTIPKQQIGMSNAASKVSDPEKICFWITEGTMKTQAIPRDEWTGFFDRLSRKHEGWEVTLEVLGPDIGDQVEERQMFLSGVTAEMADGNEKIAIMMGGRPSDHVTHVITAPTQVDLQKTDLGIDATLQIKSADGTTSLLHLS
jgi:Family of unknown function (DUF5335)